MSARVKSLVASLLALVVGLGVTLAVTLSDDDHNGIPDRITVTVTKKAVAPAVQAAKAPPAGDLQQQAPAQAKATMDPAQSALRDETPPDVAAEQLEQGQRQTEQLGKGLPTRGPPTGGAQNYSVTKDFSGHVYSTFGSVTPTAFCLHYTVSPNVTGWADVRGVQAYFQRTRVGSATYIADFEGHILQMVPLTRKAWTQGAMNPFCRASVEIIATGRESRAQWRAAPLIRDGVLAALMHDVMSRYRLPRRFVDPVGCSMPPGYTDHNHMECGNDHTDVAPSFPFAKLARQLKALDAKKVAGKVGTPVARKICKRVNHWRKTRRRGTPLRQANLRVKWLRAHGYVCTGRGLRPA